MQSRQQHNRNMPIASKVLGGCHVIIIESPVELTDITGLEANLKFILFPGQAVLQFVLARDITSLSKFMI